MELINDCSYLDTNGEVVLFDVFIIERMVDFDVGPGVTVVGALLEVERVVLVGLRRRTADQSVEDGRIVLDTRTEHRRNRWKNKH